MKRALLSQLTEANNAAIQYIAAAAKLELNPGYLKLGRHSSGFGSVAKLWRSTSTIGFSWKGSITFWVLERLGVNNTNQKLINVVNLWTKCFGFNHSTWFCTSNFRSYDQTMPYNRIIKRTKWTLIPPQ